MDIGGYDKYAVSLGPRNISKIMAVVEGSVFEPEPVIGECLQMKNKESAYEKFLRLAGMKSYEQVWKILNRRKCIHEYE
jgi:hypothetical protein